MPIANDHQRAVTAARRAELQHELSLLPEPGDDIYVELTRASLLGVIRDLDNDIDTYDHAQLTRLADEVVELAAALPPMTPEQIESFLTRVKAAVWRRSVKRRRLPVRLTREQISHLAAAARHTRDTPPPGTPNIPEASDVLHGLITILEAMEQSMASQPASAVIDIALERRAALAACACASYATQADTCTDEQRLHLAQIMIVLCEALDIPPVSH